MNSLIPAAEFSAYLHDLWDYHCALVGWLHQSEQQYSDRLFRCPEWDFAQQGAIP